MLHSRIHFQHDSDCLLAFCEAEAVHVSWLSPVLFTFVLPFTDINLPGMLMGLILPQAVQATQAKHKVL
jgi:hypothetical protein